MSDVSALKIDPMRDFQEKLQARIRDDIAQLLPDDAVADLVKKAVEKTFFEPRVINEGYGRQTEHPSWFIEAVTKAAEPAIARAVADRLSENNKHVERVINEFLDQNKLTVLVTQHLTSMLSGAIFSLDQTLQRTRM